MATSVLRCAGGSKKKARNAWLHAQTLARILFSEGVTIPILDVLGSLSVVTPVHGRVSTCLRCRSVLLAQTSAVWKPWQPLIRVTEAVTRLAPNVSD